MSLLSDIKSKRAGLTRAKRKARSTKADPRDAVDAAEEAKRLPGEIKALEQAIDQNRELITKLKAVAKQIHKLPHQSRERSMARTKLEEAAMWLREELEG